MNSYLMAWMQFSDFSSRTTQREFAAFALPHIAIGATLAWMMGSVLSTPFLVYVAISLVPAIAIGARRLHDAGHSRWYLLVGLVPLVRGLLVVFLFAEPSQDGARSLVQSAGGPDEPPKT